MRSYYVKNKKHCSKWAILTPMSNVAQDQPIYQIKHVFFFKLLLFAQNKQVSSKWLSLVRMIEYSQKKSLFRPILRHPVDGIN